MNYKSALVPTDKHKPSEQKKEKTQLQSVIKYGEWEGRPGWVKIYSVIEPVAINKKREQNLIDEKINLDSFVKLQERRIAEYDSQRWEGAFREMYPIYPPYPECEDDSDYDDGDGQYSSDNEGFYYSDPEY